MKIFHIGVIRQRQPGEHSRPREAGTVRQSLRNIVYNTVQRSPALIQEEQFNHLEVLLRQGDCGEGLRRIEVDKREQRKNEKLHCRWEKMSGE
ncbi:hypothetical protein SRHO_G00110660 [Serrasalmus rhombeus]